MMSQPGTDENIDAGLSDQEDLHRFLELGRLSASLLHEISGPLTAAMLQLEQVDDQQSHSLKSARRSLVRLSLYVNAARQQLRSQSQPVYFYVDKQMDEIKRLVRPLAKSKGVSLSLAAMPRLKLRGDPVKFQQVITNLLINAVESYETPELDRRGQSLVQVTASLSKRYLSLSITDWGKGIDEKQLDRLFEPFYTTKASGQGLGLGLFIVKRYVEADLAGRIKVNVSRSAGTRFVVILPLIDDSQS